MREVYCDLKEEDFEDSFSEVWIARDQSDMFRRALVSPNVSADVKERIRSHAAVEYSRLQDAGEIVAAAYYDLLNQ